MRCVRLKGALKVRPRWLTALIRTQHWCAGTQRDVDSLMPPLDKHPDRGPASKISVSSPQPPPPPPTPACNHIWPVLQHFSCVWNATIRGSEVIHRLPCLAELLPEVWLFSLIYWIINESDSSPPSPDHWGGAQTLRTTEWGHYESCDCCGSVSHLTTACKVSMSETNASCWDEFGENQPR